MPETRRLKLIISYDGRDFAGWQSQKHRNTVQDNLEAAFERVCGRRLIVSGSGRTDTGVHALGQCAHVDVPAAQFAAERWLKALNGVLPQTIRILRARFVSNSFHARFSAKGKVYRYRIINGPVRPPLEIGRAWHIAASLDRNSLKRAAKLFIGRHDFASFSANRGKEARSTVRKIDYVRITARRRLDRNRNRRRRVSLQDGATHGRLDRSLCPRKRKPAISRNALGTPLPRQVLALSRPQQAYI